MLQQERMEIEIDLINRALTGSKPAQNKLIGQWFKRIYNYCLAYFNDHDLAMEAAQKTFIQMVEKGDQLHDVSRFRCWLYRIAFNFCHEEKRKSSRLMALDSSLTVAATDTADILLHVSDMKKIIRDLLDQLPEEQKEVIVLKELEGLKFREIAEILHISENTVKSRCYYGLKAMNEQLKRLKIKKENIYGHG